jgi:hypothetical protein
LRKSIQINTNNTPTRTSMARGGADPT